MTRDEKIAEKMGWEWIVDEDVYHTEWWEDKNGTVISTNDVIDFNDIYIAHILIGRMVDDGLRVKIWHTADGVYADATSGEGDNFKWYVGSKREGWDNTFSPAVVELFCKVYGIEDK
jgi:hypothetical protein